MSGRTRRAWLLSPLLFALAACASAPEAAAPDTATVWGSLKLVPREGVTPAKPGSASYGDRRMRDVELVDYTHPGFAVVFVEAEPVPTGQVEIAIRTSRFTRFEPAMAAAGAGASLVIENASDAPHVLSYPAAGLIRRLAPGEKVELPIARAGEQGLFLLDSVDASATLFAAPGPFAVLSSTGSFELRGLPPGPHKIRAWHPRFPPASKSVELAAGARVQLDIEIGVGQANQEHAHEH
jgi:hypothetical protein